MKSKRKTNKPSSYIKRIDWELPEDGVAVEEKDEGDQKVKRKKIKNKLLGKKRYRK